LKLQRGAFHAPPTEGTVAISKPVAIYNAENNIEAQLLCAYLEQNGIEAYPTLDESVAFWSLGAVPEIHKPQVWIDEANVGATQPLLVEYERERQRRRATSEEELCTVADTVAAVCEVCGKTTVSEGA